MPHAPPALPQAVSSPPLPPRAQAPASLRYTDPKLIVVSNLDTSVDEALLQRFFAFCGAIQQIYIDSAASLAMIEFRLAKSLTVARVMTGAVLGGEAINVELYNATRHGRALFDTMFAKEREASSVAPPLPPRPSETNTSSSSAVS